VASEGKVILPVLVGILILGVLGFSLDAFAEPLSLFHTSFVDSFSIEAPETAPSGLAFSFDGTKMFVTGGDGNDVGEYTLSTAFDASTASFVDSFSVAVQETAPTGVAFSSDGTKMFVLGLVGADVNEYTLSTGFDVSTAIFEDSFSVSIQDVNPGDIAFSSDGTKMFVLGSFGADVNEYTLSTGFDVSTAAFVDSFSVAAQEDGPTGLAFSSDGTKMFVVGVVGDDVNQYTLSTGFDVSTATFVDSFSVKAQETIPRGLAFSSDGTKMFVLGQSGDDVNEYSLTTPFTLFHTTFVDSFSVAEQEINPRDLTFSPDGTKMFVVGSTQNDIHEYTLTTGFDVFTASFVDSFSVSIQDINPEDVAFSPDGTKMFVVGNREEAIHEYTLTTGFDVSTASFEDSFSVSDQDSVPTGVAFSSDGKKMFVVGIAGDSVHEYTLSTGFDVSTASFVDSFSVFDRVINPEGIAFSSDGKKMFVISANADGVAHYALADGFDVSTASFVVFFSVSDQDNAPQGLAFSSDGTKMFVIGDAGNDINEYTLADGFTLFHTTFVNSFSVAVQETDPTGVAFSSDGAKMFVVGFSGESVNEYTLVTAFDVSTASFVDSFSVAVQETSPEGVAFSSDGTKMFVVGNSGDDVNEYTLSTGFDVSTASFEDSFSVAVQEITPRGFSFSSDGTKMFVVGNAGDDVNEYTLTTGFDVSTASFVDSFSVAGQETNPTGVAFSSDGTKMFVVGNDGDDINEYTLTTGFDVSTASFEDSFSVVVQDTSPNDVVFSSDGAKMFVVGREGEDVNEYAIVFIDTKKPVISPNGVSTSITFGSVYTELGATVTDNDSAYSETVAVGGDTVNTSVAGDYTITYNAPADAAGNIPDEKSITITVLPPIVPCSPPPSEIWIITESCEISSEIIAPASVMIQNNSVVIINSEGSLTVQSGENLIIVGGSGLKLIQGSTLQVNS